MDESIRLFAPAAATAGGGAGAGVVGAVTPPPFAKGMFPVAISGDEFLRIACQGAITLDVIEILDNASWVFVSRSGRAADQTLQDLLNDRANIRRDNPHLRVFSVWTAREQGQLQDAVSKLDLPHPKPTDSLSGHDWANDYLWSSGLPTLESARRLPRL